MKTSDRIDFRLKSGLEKLMNGQETILVDEQVVINALLFLGRKYFGAIDTEDKNAMFDHYGIHFEPSRNNGENKWLLTNMMDVDQNRPTKVAEVEKRYSSVIADIYAEYHVSPFTDIQKHNDGIIKAMVDFAIFYKEQNS